MPTYEYECQKCQHRFELFQAITDKPKRSCPKCRGRVKRLLGTGAGIIFKGSGFYSTDYRKPSYTEAAKKEASAPASPSETKESPAPKPSTAKSPPSKS